ncbi:sensor histidine kinase [Streptomyces sp. NPDC093589]|uniref:sensor histidine kinase n=1 Tax=Streptomyces sp. NPDC093589 TaxID=3366043 RepID=UPI0037FF48E7
MRRAAVSLRWKIALTVTAVCCAVAAVLGVLVHNAVARQTVGQVRKEARADLDTALDLFEYGTSREGINSVLDPPELPDELQKLARDGKSGSMVGRYHGQPVMWAAAPAGDQVMAVWSPYGSTRRSLEKLDTAILGSAVLAATAVALAGLFLAQRISRRLGTTAAVARRITAGDLDARVGDAAGRGPGGGPAGRDEVAAVAAALDSVAGSLQSRLHAEQRFTADVAHELRTPLTGILASAELLPEGRPKEMINDRLRALHRLTEDLLEISRLDSGSEHADLAAYELGALVERSVRATGLDTDVRIATGTGTGSSATTGPSSPMATGAGPDAPPRADGEARTGSSAAAHPDTRPEKSTGPRKETPTGAPPGADTRPPTGAAARPPAHPRPPQGMPSGTPADRAAEIPAAIPDAIVIETDRRRLDRIIANLVINAHRHGGPPVTVTVDVSPSGNPTIEVRDHGPGYPDELLHHGPQRFRTDAPGRGKGHGLGLTIAVGQAAVLGIDLRFSNAPDGGARTLLRLPNRPPSTND